MITLSVLCENNQPVSRILKAEHGLSYFIETSSAAVLFDCGQTGVALENAEKMNIPLNKTTHVVLSHSHYDHAAAYPVFVGIGVTCPLVTGSGFFEPKYAHKKGTEIYSYMGCGFGPELLNHYGIQRKVCDEKLSLGEGLWAVSNFTRTTEYETIPPRFVKNFPAPALDDFEDEVCIVAEKQDCLVVFCGCSHPGLINMLTTIQKRFQKPIETVVGGAHLAKASEERLEKTADALVQFGVQHLYLGHCTGDTINPVLEKKGLFNTALTPGDCVVL